MARKFIIPIIMLLFITGCGMPLEPFIEILIQDLPLPTVEMTQTPTHTQTPKETPTPTNTPTKVLTETPTETVLPTDTSTSVPAITNENKSRCCLCIIKSIL